MNNEPFELEFLPNEIFIILFHYFDARDLFRAFFNLNTRFNDLLLSLNNLSLTISYDDTENENDNDNIFISNIRNLIIDDEIDIDFTRFTNIHCVILMYDGCQQIEQLDNNILPSLKHLTIRDTEFLLSTELLDIYNRIFSNHFSHLESCYVSDRTIIRRSEEWMQMSSLRILEVGLVNIFVYKSILLLCPNLYSFKCLTFLEVDIPSHIKSHLNIKRLILKNDYFFQSWDSRVMETYLSCLPNLEQLCLNRHIFSSNMNTCLMNYDWCASLIRSYLPLLRRFSFYLHVVKVGRVNINNIVRRLEENFQFIHNGRYQTWFAIECSKMTNLVR